MMWRPVSVLAATAVLALTACDRAEADFRERVKAAALAAAPDPAEARVIVILGNASMRKACGWMDAGRGRGVVPFAATDRAGKPIHILTPDVVATGSAARIHRAYRTQFVMVICDDHGWLAPAPAGVRNEPDLDAPLRRLVNTPGNAWVVVPDGASAFIAVAKAAQGGLRFSPRFAVRADAERWVIENGGHLPGES